MRADSKADWAPPGVPGRAMVAVRRVIAAACVACCVAWPVCAVAFAPYALWVLAAAPLWPSVLCLLRWLLLTLLPTAALDSFFYGRPTLSLWNFVR